LPPGRDGTRGWEDRGAAAPAVPRNSEGADHGALVPRVALVGAVPRRRWSGFFRAAAVAVAAVAEAAEELGAVVAGAGFGMHTACSHPAAMWRWCSAPR
jgi:hypothetical protein